MVEGNDIGTNAAGTAAVANGIGINVYDPGATIGGTTNGAGNTISDNSQAGIEVTSRATATITNDLITGDGTGILVGSGASDTCVVTAQDDDLSGNTTAGITNYQTNPADAVTATDDWWGSSLGPTATANPSGNGTSVSSNVILSPWIGVYTPGPGPGFQPTGVTLGSVPTQFTVTSTADSGPGTLRQAISSVDASEVPPIPSCSTSARRAPRRRSRWRRPCQRSRTPSTSRGIPSQGSPACRWWSSPAPRREAEPTA